MQRRVHSVRLADRERSRISESAAACGLTFAEFVRSAALDRARRSRAPDRLDREIKELAQSISDQVCGVVAASLRDAVRERVRAREVGSAVDLDTILAELAESRAPERPSHREHASRSSRGSSGPGPDDRCGDAP